MKPKVYFSKTITPEKVLELYRQKGYGAVERWYRKRLGIQWYRYALQMRIPPKLRALLKR